ncbi:melanocyte protein PMEL-like [Brachionichthys hirsutus]|uniref:melanocyte protein PMEL-like n=1 Tax=Brachionichthys hirsutus TaxID=412623 RepID=UPI0036049827
MRGVLLLVLLAGVSHAAAKPKNRFIRYPSWNNKMYPIWKDGDPRFQDSWKGGRMIFNVGNDSPTLTGAKVTFTIDLEFPHRQRERPDGDVVWTEDCVINGTGYRESEPVYPTQNTDWAAVFPDGTPVEQDKKPSYVFVWKAWGRYWQVADGSSSSLTVSTDDVPLGSYAMDVVIYHYRSKEKFIPLGYASSQFSITDQIPFAVSLDQVNDIVAGDMRFIRNRAIAFTVTLHDPSDYLGGADITFNWEFGDESGALISRELTVTHTYVDSGSFKPRVVIQAVIPDKACGPPAEATTEAPRPATVKSPGLVSTMATGLNVSMVRLVATAAGPLSSIGGDLPPEVRRPAALTGRAKRTVEDDPSDDDCVIYRYGSFSAGIEVFEGIEKVAIVHMDNVVTATPEMDRNVLDITVTCQGSLPKEVCSVILDAECFRPIHTTCNMVAPSNQCQLVLRNFFNHSGVYCINVSLANDVSLAATSAKVKVTMGPGISSPGSVATVLGVLLLVVALGTVAYSYNRLQSYRPLKDDTTASAGPQPGRAPGCSGASLFWNLLNRRGAVDDGPLLQDKPV